MKLLGILGGMGPEAGLEFAKILIELTPAEKDQDHLEFILLNLSSVPDRTAHILGKGPDPVPRIIEGIKLLERAGAIHVIIPCNTAHYFFERISSKVSCYLYNMVALAVEELERRGIEKVGLLATTGTVRSGLYEKYLKNFTVIKPENQQAVQKAIYERAKKGDMEAAAEELERLGLELMARGAEAVLLGCTEVETALRRRKLPFPTLGPMQIAAEKILRDFGKIR